MLRIVFIGCVLSSQYFLKTLLTQSNVEIIGIVTRSSANYNADFVNLESLAEANHIPCFSVNKLNQNQLPDWIKSFSPDVIYCFGWSFLLNKSILKASRLGVIGYHSTKLPENRGRHPLIWTLALGMSQTASTFFFMDEHADSGDIISQKIIEIDEMDNAYTLYEKLLEVANLQLIELTYMLDLGTYIRIPQKNEHATYWRKRTPEDGKIDWRMSARSIHNLVRALTGPYPGAHCIYFENEAKVWKTEIAQCAKNNIEPGKILDVEKVMILVKCGEDAIKLTHHDLFPIPRKGDYL